MYLGPEGEIAIALSRDPVARGVARILGVEDRPLGSCCSVVRRGELLILVYDGDSLELPPEEKLRSLGIGHIVVPSRHEMARPRPMLTAHTPGVPPSLSVAYAELKTWLFRELCLERPPEFECALEATHHEPNTEIVSATFIEIGSTEREWNDERPLKGLSWILGELPNYKPVNAPVIMSVGDLHYSMVTQMALDGLANVGHIIHKDVATRDLVAQAFNKHVKRPERVIFFKKSVKSPIRNEIIEKLKELGVPIELKG